MSQVGQLSDTWPGGLTYVFQGTIAEDATAGTHVCSVTITPGVGTELEVLYGLIQVGNTATAQTGLVDVNDGTNLLGRWMSVTVTTASLILAFPSVQPTGGAAANQYISNTPRWLVSGGMNLVLKVSTAAVSVTQTFAVACRIRGQKPTVVLNDTIGTSTNTVNTDAVF